MKNSNLKICDVFVKPGEAANLALPLPEQYSCAPLYMPIKIIHGKMKGPLVLIFSTLNGNELNGIEIVNRVIDEVDADQIRGTIIAIPVLNVYGLTHFPSLLPSEQKLSECFPGKENGTFGERLAHIFTQEILKKADYCIELETGDINHNILPQVYCNLENAQTKKLAKAFNCPVITAVPIEGNTLRQVTENLNIPLLVYQAGEAMRFDENSIAAGYGGVINVLRYLDVLPKEAVQEIKPIISHDENWITAHRAGILHTTVSLGQLINKSEVIGKIRDPFIAGDSEVLKSPRDGIVVGINTTPLIHEGLPIFKIASFLDYERAGASIEEWDKSQPDSLLS